MALIKCPECKRKVSDQCENCPHCGYPIKANLSSVIKTGTTNPPLKKTRLFKFAWLWSIIVAIVIIITILVIQLLNREVSPKVDDNGNPAFVELTDEVYTNADDYLGYYVSIKGKVFQNLGSNGETKSVQIWLDPNSCEQNLLIQYTTDETLNDGDYIVCTGYIKKIHTYTNAYGAELSVPLIVSNDLSCSSYIDVMAPTVLSIIPKNLTYEKYGYSITVDRVEYAKSETRVYLSASNNGNGTLYLDTDSSIIVQNGKQFNATTNFEANYENIPYNLSKGTTASGVVVFPAISNEQFEYAIELHSNISEEKFRAVTFQISTDSSATFILQATPSTVWNFDNLKYETKGYAIVISKIEFYDDETLFYITATNNGTATLHVDTDSSVIVQNKQQYIAESVYDTDCEGLPYSIAKGASVAGVIVYPTINPAEFDYTIEMHSENYAESFKYISFKISKDKPTCINQENEAWRLTALLNSSQSNWETSDMSIKNGDSIYLHLVPKGGKPGAKLRIKETRHTPDGQTISHVFDESFSANQKALYGWLGGLYENAEDSPCGMFRIEFFNADTGEKIGETSVQLTK